MILKPDTLAHFTLRGGLGVFCSVWMQLLCLNTKERKGSALTLVLGNKQECKHKPGSYTSRFYIHFSHQRQQLCAKHTSLARNICGKGKARREIFHDFLLYFPRTCNCFQVSKIQSSSLHSDSVTETPPQPLSHWRSYKVYAHGSFICP